MNKEQKEKTANISTTWYCIKVAFKSNPVAMSLLLFIKIATSAALAASIFVLALLLDQVALIGSAGFNNKEIIANLIIWLVLMGFTLLMPAVEKYVKNSSSLLLTTKLDRALLHKKTKVKYANIITTKYKHQSKLADDGIESAPIVIYGIFDIFGSVVETSLIFVTLITFHFSIPLILIGGAIPMIAIAIKMNLISYRLRTAEKVDERICGIYTDALSSKESLPEVRAYNANKMLLEKWTEANCQYNECEIKRNMISAKYVLFKRIVKCLVEIAAFGFVLYLAIGKYILVGQLVATIVAIRQFTFRTYGIANKMGSFYRETSHVADYIKFMKYEETQPGTRSLKKLESKIVFDNVVFRYPKPEDKENSPIILNKASFTLYRGERVALVGENGCGKTTLANAFVGLLEPESGTIKFDDIPLSDINIEDKKRMFSIFFQDTLKYPSMSIRENITLSNVDKINGDIEIGEALDKATARYASGADLTQNLDSLIGREFDGYEFSGGEYQKLAIARALFKKDSQIYVFDEPTSAIDALVEEKILGNFLSETEGKTALIISHRLSLCKNVDRILFMEKGQIVEDGSHRELMKIKDGKYAKMFKSQEKWYK